MASPTIKRQRQRKRIDTDGDPEFQVAPMVDVLLVLMLFFMAITSTEVLQKDKHLQLATAEHGKKAEHKDTNKIIVNVGWDKTKSEAQFSMDGIGYSGVNSMQGALATRFKQNPAAYVLIRADKDVEYSNIADLMNVCANVGIGTVTFAVLTSGGKKNAPAAPPGGTAAN